MARIDDIRSKVIRDEFEFTRHALDRTILRRIHVSEIREAIDTGQIIEDYPEDKYGPSCLILGCTQAGRPLHLQLTYPLQSLIKLITVYEPDPDEWVDFRIRR